MRPHKEYITPSVSFLVIAHNEAEIIGEKIQNCLKLNYPKDKIEYVIVSSGSTDNTEKIVSPYNEENIRLVVLPENRGKAWAINQIVPELKGEIIVFSDTRQMYTSNSVAELVANFNDPSVGGTSGELMLSPPENQSGMKGVFTYWDYEKLIRRKESDVYSNLGVTGAIYAIRKQLFEPIPNDTVLDDFVIPMNILRRGYRVVFDGSAKAWDYVTDSYNKEFTRKVRTLGGNYQAFSRMPYLFNYKANPAFFQFISHKFFRLLVPFFLVVLIVTNLFLESFWYRLFFGIQLVFYLSAIMGLKYKLGIFSFFSTFLILNCASVVGLYKFLTNSLNAAWKSEDNIS